VEDGKIWEKSAVDGEIRHAQKKTKKHPTLFL
jgi:hypothetical protein